MSFQTLRSLMNKHFNLGEVRGLCFALDIPSDNIAAATRDDMVRGLISYCERRNKLENLLEQLNQERPSVNWPTIDSFQSDTSIPSWLEQENVPDTNLLGINSLMIGGIFLIVIVGIIITIPRFFPAVGGGQPSATLPPTEPSVSEEISGTGDLESPEIIEDTSTPTKTPEPILSPTIEPTATATAVSTPTQEPTATITPEPTQMPTPISTLPPPPETVVFNVNRIARSFTNSDLQVTWQTIELDPQSGTTIIRLAYENSGGSPLNIQINDDITYTYLGLQNGSRKGVLGLGPDTDSSGLDATLQPNTVYEAWVEFPGIIDVSQTLHLLLGSPYVSAEDFPVISNVQIDTSSADISQFLPDNSVSNGIEVYEINRLARSTNAANLELTWQTVELDSRTNTTVIRLLYENSGNVPLLLQVHEDIEYTYLRLSDGNEYGILSVEPSFNVRFSQLLTDIHPGTTYAITIEFSGLIDLPQTVDLAVGSPGNSSADFPIFEDVSIGQ